MPFLTDRQGIPLACSEPMAGNHNDLFDIEKTVSKIVDTFLEARIAIAGLFMNADAGLDSKALIKEMLKIQISTTISLITNCIKNGSLSKELTLG